MSGGRYQPLGQQQLMVNPWVKTAQGCWLECTRTTSGSLLFSLVADSKGGVLARSGGAC